MLFYIQKGDIFKIDGIKNYAHGCNCAGAMGKGIALQFRNKFPQMYEQYKALCKNHKFVGGDVFKYQYKNDGFIYNLGTQRTWMEKAEMEFIEKSLRTIMDIAIKDGVQEIAIPAIGAGLGGGNWNEIKDIIKRVSSDYPYVDLYVVEQYNDVETKICYIKKEWEEEKTLFYINFIGDNAVRQIEIHRDEKIFLSTEHPVQGDCFLCDQSLKSLDLSSTDYISKDEFDEVWYSQQL